MDGVNFFDVISNWAKDRNLFIPEHIILASLDAGGTARLHGKSGYFGTLFALYSYTGIKPDVELSKSLSGLDD